MKYILLFMALFAILKTYIYLAKRFNITDKPNNRSSHQTITVRGGGIIFPIGTLFWFLVSGFQYPLFFLGLAILSLTSFLDDVLQLSNRIRFFIQLGSVMLIAAETGLQLFPWWIWITILIIATGIINAFNFMDGINGITGGYSLAVLFGLWLVNNFQESFIPNEFIYFTAIPLAVFGLFNFRKKAICFAGDVGSVSIAFIVVFMLFLLILKTGNLTYIFFLGIYGTDSILTIIHRLRKKENIFEAHRKHIYQLMANELKIPHLWVAGIYAALQLLICVIIFLAAGQYSGNSGIYPTGLGTIAVLMLLFAGGRYLINLKLAGNKEKVTLY